MAEEKVIECEFHAACANFILRGEEAPSSFGYEGVARSEPERCMIDTVQWSGVVRVWLIWSRSKEILAVWQVDDSVVY